MSEVWVDIRNDEREKKQKMEYEFGGAFNFGLDGQ